MCIRDRDITLQVPGLLNVTNDDSDMPMVGIKRLATLRHPESLVLALLVDGTIAVCEVYGRPRWSVWKLFDDETEILDIAAAENPLGDILYLKTRCTGIGQISLNRADFDGPALDCWAMIPDNGNLIAPWLAGRFVTVRREDGTVVSLSLIHI